MFTLIDTYSSAVTAHRIMLTAPFARTCDQGWLHADVTLAGRSVR
jgi:hypothetical protein